MSVREALKTEAPGPDVRRVRRVLVGILIAGVLGAIVSIAVLSRTDDRSLAELRIRDDSVDVRGGGSAFRGGIEGQRLAVGDSIRTNSQGQAQIDYFDGSLTRLDSNTIFVIRELADAPASRRVSLELDAGRTWNRVKELTSAKDRYEVRAGNAVATVRGTAFLVDCRRAPTCYYFAAEREINVTSTSGETRDLNENDCVKATQDAGLVTCTAEELRWLLDGWAEENRFMDGMQRLELKQEPTTQPPPPAPAAVKEGGRRRTRRSAPSVATPGHAPDWLNEPGSGTRTHSPRTPEPPVSTEPPPPDEDEPEETEPPSLS